MRKVILFNMISLDGFFESGPGGIEWHNADEEFNDFAIDQLKMMDIIMFGRVTYEGMASYWPTPMAIESDPVVANAMNTMPKIVFSRTLDKADWNNTRLIKDNVAEEVQKLKQQPGKDLYIFGSANLGASFTEMGLIDEYRVIINPVVLGGGNPLFKNKLNLKLTNSRIFKSGNVLLSYEPC